MNDTPLSPSPQKTTRSLLQRYFVTGLLVWVPLVVTIWVITQVLGTLDGVFGSVMHAVGVVLPDDFGPALLKFRNIPGVGVLLVIAVVLATGVLAANIFGQWWLRQWDRLMTRIPIVKSIYSSVKQVSDTLFSSSGNAFSKALLIQYPRQGSWTIAFLTGKPGGDVVAHLPTDCVSVYVPTTPNPTSGFFLMLPRTDVVELEMSVDDALKYIVSMGVVAPPSRPH